MESIAIIFPHQLFEKSPLALAKYRTFLIEEFLFFSQYFFHKQKIAFHRASMKAYEQHLVHQGLEMNYIVAHQREFDVRVLIDSLSNRDQLTIIDPTNYLLRRVYTSCKRKGIEPKALDNPSFINTKEDLASFFLADKKKFFQTEFYTQQRKNLNTLIDETKKPIGRKWTYDTENRKKFPAKGTHKSNIRPTPPSIMRR